MANGWNMSNPVYRNKWKKLSRFPSTAFKGFNMIYRKPPTRSHAASIWAWLVEWVYKPWLLFRKCFPNERRGWLLYKTQHLPVFTHLQAMACKRGWLKYESGLSYEFFADKTKPRSSVSHAAYDRGLRYKPDKSIMSIQPRMCKTNQATIDQMWHSVNSDQTISPTQIPRSKFEQSQHQIKAFSKTFGIWNISPKSQRRMEVLRKTEPS